MQHQQFHSDSYITASFPNPKSAPLDPSNVSIVQHHTPETIEEAIALSNALSTHQQSPQSANGSRSRIPLERSNSSEWWMEIRKTPTPKHTPRSRKTPFATIVTDATEEHPAFESDAFAIQMPTTREPIMEPETPSFRAKLPRPSTAQMVAYQSYQEKAKRNMETEYKKDYIPVKVANYNYAYRSPEKNANYTELAAATPSSPPTAGAFPVSPPVPQHAFTPSKPTNRVSRSISDSPRVQVTRRPVAQSSSVRIPIRYKYQGDVEGGATTTAHYCPSPSPFPGKDEKGKPKIKVRIKPKGQTQDSPQKESWWGLYTRSPSPQSTSTASTASSSDSTRGNISTAATTPFSTSPPRPVFAYTTKPFPLPTPTPTPTTSPQKKHTKAPLPTTTPTKTSKSKTPEKRTLTSRLAWFRPAGPRIHKPSATRAAAPETPSKATTTAIATATGYLDPFTLHSTPIPTNPTNTPTPSRSPSPRKLLLRSLTQPRGIQTPIPTPIIPAPPKQKVESGLSQLKSAVVVLVKLGLVLYVLVGLYFVMDAVREAMHALGAPVRGVKVVGGVAWRVGVWVVDVGRRVWERWGVRVVAAGRGGRWL